VLPDGCRDIIYRAEPGCRPKWFVSRLFDTVKVITLQPATLSIGLRIAPGARFEEKRLLQELGRFDGDDGRVIELIEEFTHRAKSVEDALEALAENGASVSSVARRLGIQERMLQRRVRSTTDRSPAYWIQLARVRKAARLLSRSFSLSEIAAICGFADQAHMTRAFRKWFGVPPASFRQNADFMEMIASCGYDGAAATGEQISIRKPSGSRT
jgi:AraC-like DNA-binding protein